MHLTLLYIVISKMRKYQRRQKEEEGNDRKNVDGWSIDGRIERSIDCCTSWVAKKDSCYLHEWRWRRMRKRRHGRTNHIGHSTIYFNDAATFCTTTHCQFLWLGYESHLADINYMTGANSFSALSTSIATARKLQKMNKIDWSIPIF